MKNLIVILFLLTESLIAYSQSTLNINVVNEEIINTSEHEFSPTKWNNQFIYVSSSPAAGKNYDKKSKSSFFNLKFTASNFNGNLLKSANLPQLINSNYHEGPACYHHESNTLYFTRTDMSNGRKYADQNGKVKLQIYTAVNVDGKWSKPKKLGIDQKAGSYCHPSISEDGKTLVFASDIANIGKMDIYYCTMINEVWSAPLPITNINSQKNDWFPFLHPAGYLLFASDGRSQDQGLDIFISQIENDSFGTPKLLPYPINSNFDDFGVHLSLNCDSGYFSSNRPKGLGKDDIYSFESNLNIGRYLFDLSDNETVLSQSNTSVVKKLENKTTDVTTPNYNGKIEVQKPNNTTTKISPELGAITTFDNIYFDFDSENVDSPNRNLDELSILMHNIGQIKIQISAHTDSRGRESYNQELSDKRANATKRYLISKGIDANRIIALGFGESRLKNQCVDGVNCNENQHKENRRIEVKIIDN